MKRSLLERLRCVNCQHNKLALEVNTENEKGILEGTLVCPSCSTLYKIKRGVPVLHPPSLKSRFDQSITSSLLVNRVDEKTMNATDKLDEWLYYDNKFSPKPDEPQSIDYGIGWSCKPAVSHTDMLSFHLNRIFRDMKISLQDKHVVNLGCGPGREMEYLSRKHKAVVTGLDISHESVCAAMERSINFHYQDRCDGVSGDMEILPFKDKSFDIALISTALHHISEWRTVIKEMVRVSKEGIIIDESTDAFITKLAVFFGFSENVEEHESGNRVIRFNEDIIIPVLKELGVCEYGIRRYWLNTSHRFRWLTIRDIRLRKLMSLFESEALLRIQSILLDRIGNRFTIYAKL